jgi:DNA-binding HxlR family transcriptional regulator
MPSRRPPTQRRKQTSAHLEHERKLVASCPVMAALTLLRARWKLPLLWRLRNERCTLAELRRDLAMASEKMLAQHLGELVRDGFVERRQSPRNRRDVTYLLTVLGRSLLPTMETLRVWSIEQGMVAKATASLVD